MHRTEIRIATTDETPGPDTFSDKYCGKKPARGLDVYPKQPDGGDQRLESFTIMAL